MKQRLITGIIAGAFFLGLCLVGGTAFELLILLMALIGYYEFVKMTGVSPKSAASVLGYMGVVLFFLPWGQLHLPLNWGSSALIWLLLLLFASITVFSKNRFSIKEAALLLFGAVYVGIGFSAISGMRGSVDGHGLFWTFLLLCSIWASDAGAYFVGKAIGRTKLWPAISPNKTVEGALGGVIIAIVVAVIFALFSGGLLGLPRAVLIGACAAVVGQMGDLVQSAYKRVYGIKDSGNLLPGHGGILDRCDSWIIVFPFVHFLTLLPS
ncbi:phosphatidate cytidylyltransferase [Paenibacillus physcomitrellae]|uniref:Phosphatidate cytidylyltransferase n=1 Tax=Paenibacillus physcomitrellae TaxID=1619311 RepID=A0ABQ1G9R3_9BACL|nr:phosphatidate cytidylyltransferase [Paenibacillus physcomitrellae]GGA39473.1 phosphatidate cytidylyltransferase [Paenibacillus physcomitrellae]